jgi:dTDP-glucose 4,6-dehydratase
LSVILVTGGLGFIGSNFIHYLADQKTYQILNLDAMSYGANPRNLESIQDSALYSFVKGDIADGEAMEKFVHQVQYIVHFAAETHVDRSISDPQSFLRSNVIGTLSLLEAARKCGIRKFVHISTDEVYGSAPLDRSFTEAARFDTSSPYAASKAAAEMFVEAYHKSYGLHTVVLRCTNNFGPYQFPEKFIPKTIINALLGRKVAIYGDGRQVRDWIYVQDFCAAIESAVEKGPAGSVYNVSAENEMPNLEVVKRILKMLGKPTDLVQFVEDRPGHDFRYSLDSGRIRSELGWKPQHNFQASLQETVEWYVKNDWWWRPLISDKVLSATPWKEKW